MFGFPGWTLKQTKYLIKLKFWKQPADHTVGKNLKKNETLGNHNIKATMSEFFFIMKQPLDVIFFNIKI